MSSHSTLPNALGFNLFTPYKNEVDAAVFTRNVDIFNTGLANAIQFDDQKHGEQVITIQKGEIERPLYGDALITKLTNTPLIIRIADCASIVMYDKKQYAIANIHAGWRGLARRIIRETIQEMGRRFHTDPTDLVAAISPMLGPCCARFSDPQRELPKHMHRYILEENMVDLWGATEGQLKECGVPKEQIENRRLCTFCNPHLFHSYRRDKENAGRFGTAIWLT